MKKTVILFVALMLAACAMGGGSDSGGGTPQEPESLVSSIAELPDMRMSLPNSLGGQNSTTPATSASRAAGDLSILVQSEIDGVRSEAWIEINQRFNSQNPLLSQNIALLFLDEIKQYAEEKEAAGEELVLGTIYSLGVRDLLDQYTMDAASIGLMSMDLGRFVIEQSGDVKEIFWSTPWPMTNYDYNPSTGEYDETSYTTQLRFYFIIDERDSNKQVTFTMEEINGEMAYYSYFNENDEVLESYNFGEDYSGSSYAEGSANSIILFESYSDTDPADSSISDKIVYGDNNSGGLISVYEGQYEYLDYDNNPVVEDYNSARTEFFDSEGNLILEEWGETNVMPYWTNIENYDYSQNLYSIIGSGDAPDSVLLREDYMNYPSTWSYSIDNGSTWTSLSQATYELYWKAGNTWQPGDCSYWWDSSTSTPGSYTIRLVKGNVFTAPRNFFGVEYSVSMSYPLKELLPLAGDWAATHDLVQVEGDYSEEYDWDEDGIIDYYWTDYSFYLVDKGQTQVTDTDLQISGLCEQDYYYWDNSGMGRSVKAYTFNTSATLPSYFQFQKQNLVDSVQTQIESLYNNEYQSWKNKNYQAIHAEIMPAAENFADLEG